MKYKVGDKVKIARMEEYSQRSKEALSKTNYIVTIKEVLYLKAGGTGYEVEEFEMFVPLRTVVGIYKEPEDPIENRFELLDIRND